MTNFISPLVQSLVQDPIRNYPASTIACFDPTTGPLPRRRLDAARTQLFLQQLATPFGETLTRETQADAVLIGASTGQGHLRTVDELEEWFRVAAATPNLPMVLTALLRPEDGEANERLLNVLAELKYTTAFVRPGNDLGQTPSEQRVVETMRPIVSGAAKRGLAVGLYSISDVSGYPMTPDVAAELVAGDGGDHIVAIKVTEADYEQSTLKFLDDPRLAHLKIVQGWDPHLARALQDGPRHDLQRRQRCGFTSGAMSFALFPYLLIKAAAERAEWGQVAEVQTVVSHVFASMQDDPKKFADLQRAKVIMGLGQPITRDVTNDQIERVFAALDQLPTSVARAALVCSLDLLQDGPYHERLAR